MQELSNRDLLRLDAFLLRTCELEPELDSETLAERAWCALGVFCTGEDVNSRLEIYFWTGDEHFSLN